MTGMLDVCLFHGLQYLLNALNSKIQAEENKPVQKSDKRPQSMKSMMPKGDIWSQVSQFWWLLVHNE